MSVLEQLALLSPMSLRKQTDNVGSPNCECGVTSCALVSYIAGYHSNPTGDDALATEIKDYDMRNYAPGLKPRNVKRMILDGAKKLWNVQGKIITISAFLARKSGLFVVSIPYKQSGHQIAVVKTGGAHHVIDPYGVVAKLGAIQTYDDAFALKYVRMTASDVMEVYPTPGVAVALQLEQLVESVI